MTDEYETDVFDLDELAALPIFMPNVHSAAPVSEEPSVELMRWSVMETHDGTRHFKGWCGEGRVSSQIMSYDRETRTGVTKSGRRYTLIGKPGQDSDAEYVWGYWKVVNKIVEEKDVTSEYAI